MDYAYETQKFAKKCLESITAQSYQLRSFLATIPIPQLLGTPETSSKQRDQSELIAEQTEGIRKI